MAEILEYNKFISGLSEEERIQIDQSYAGRNTSVNDLFNKLENVPSFYYSMMIPRIRFYISGKDGSKRNIDIFYRNRLFSNNINNTHDDRGDISGIKEFAITSNEFIGLNNVTQFRFKFDFSNPRMLNAGHKDQAQLMEMFKVHRSMPLIAEFGWALTGNKEVDDIIKRLGWKYPIIINPANWTTTVNSDRITTVEVTGWCGANRTDMQQMFLGFSEVPEYYKQIEKIKKDQEKSTNDYINKKMPSKDRQKQIDIIQKQAISLSKEANRKFNTIYKRKFKSLETDKGMVLLGDIIKIFLEDFNAYEKFNDVDIKIVFGQFNKTLTEYFGVTYLSDIEVDKKWLEQKYFTIKENELGTFRPQTFDSIMTNLIKEYINEMGKNLNKEETFKEAQKRNEIVNPNVSINTLSYNNNLYIIIDDINRYYDGLYLKITPSMTNSEKINYAKENNIAIINLDKMNSLFIYPMNITSQVDESIQSVQIQKSYEQSKTNNIETTEININTPIQFYPITTTFSMLGNFILKPYQTILITWGSEMLCRFYTITNVTYRINEQGQFLCDYEPKHLQF